jgi:hypothetical protein
VVQGHAERDQPPPAPRIGVLPVQLGAVEADQAFIGQGIDITDDIGTANRSFNGSAA